MPEIGLKQESEKEISLEIPIKEKILDIFEDDQPKEIKQIPPKIKSEKKKISKKKTTKKNDIFFNKVKEFLSSKFITIIEVENLSKNELILRIKSKGKENVLFAYNKTRINEADIIKASKKANEIKLPYILLSKGGPLKKVENLLEALKQLDSIETLK